MSQEQLSLELNDSRQAAVAKYLLLESKVKHLTNSSIVLIESEEPGKIWLCIRTFVYETDYSNEFKVSVEDAAYLQQEYGVRCLFSRTQSIIDEYMKMKESEPTMIVGEYYRYYNEDPETEPYKVVSISNGWVVGTRMGTDDEGNPRLVSDVISYEMACKCKVEGFYKQDFPVYNRSGAYLGKIHVVVSGEKIIKTEIIP